VEASILLEAVFLLLAVRAAAAQVMQLLPVGMELR